MKPKKIHTLIYFSILFTFSVNAQDTNQPVQQCNCCVSPYTDFDFWEGRWVVKDTLGQKLGENEIKKIESNCILQESWTGETGGSGTSINYYNKIDSTWNQTWVSNTGNVLVMKGEHINNKMILKSKLVQGQKGNYYNQISWKPNNDGTVTQVWEIFSEDGTRQQSVFKGIYYKME